MPTGGPRDWGISTDDSEEEDEIKDEAGAESEEEISEVEADKDEPEADRRPSRGKAAGRPRKGRRSNRGRVWAVVVLILILVPVIGLTYFYLGPGGDIKDMYLIVIPYTSADGSTSGMTLAATVDTGKPSSLSGTASIDISYGGSSVYTGTMAISGSAGTKAIPLGQFAVANGEYIVKVRFDGHTSGTNFTAGGIVEKLEVGARAITKSTNTTMENGTASIGVNVIFLNFRNQTQKATAADRLEIEVSGGGSSSKYTENVKDKVSVDAIYPLLGAGNYTVKATFSNSKVKAGSQYSSIVELGRDTGTNAQIVVVHIPPRADAGPDQTVAWKAINGPGEPSGGKVTLDGSRSQAYGGATITSWFWDWNDGTGEDGVTVVHIYPDKTVDTPYTATLIVTDSNNETSIDNVYVTVM